MSIGNITPTAGVAATSGPTGVASTSASRPNLHSVYQAGYAAVASLLGESTQQLEELLTAARLVVEQDEQAALRPGSRRPPGGAARRLVDQGA